MPSTQEQLALFSSWIYLKVKTPPTWKPFILGSANSWFVLCGLYIYMSLKPLFPDGRGKLAGEGIGEESKGGFIFRGVYHAETFAVSFFCCSPWCWSSSLPQPHWSTEEEAGQIADMEAKLPSNSLHFLHQLKDWPLCCVFRYRQKKKPPSLRYTFNFFSQIHPPKPKWKKTSLGELSAELVWAGTDSGEASPGSGVVPSCPFPAELCFCIRIGAVCIEGFSLTMEMTQFCVKKNQQKLQTPNYTVTPTKQGIASRVCKLPQFGHLQQQSSACSSMGTSVSTASTLRPERWQHCFSPPQTQC